MLIIFLNNTIFKPVLAPCNSFLTHLLLSYLENAKVTNLVFVIHMDLFVLTYICLDP